MREYKFRGKRIDNGEWVNGYLIGNDVIVGEIIEWNSDYFNTEFWWKVDPETVGQFTGLRDRNEKEIYEGDIAQNESGKRFWFKWGINSCGFIAKTKDTHSNVYSAYHIAPKLEVIGADTKMVNNWTLKN